MRFNLLVALAIFASACPQGTRSLVNVMSAADVDNASALNPTAAVRSALGDAGEAGRTAQELGAVMSDDELIDYAKLIARDEGYDLTGGGPYEFEILDMQQSGYHAVGFDVDAHPRNLILINIRTGQAIDYNTCEVFDYPDLQPFQLRIRRVTKKTKQTAQKLAGDIGCIGAPARLLTKPVPIRKK